MKFSNKSLLALGLVAAVGLSLTSCNNTVTSRKLDGTWRVTSGSGTYYYEDDSQETNSTTTYNGTVEETEGETDFTFGSTDFESERNVTYSYTFDRKTGEYTMTQITESEETDDFTSGSYYEYDDNLDDYVYAGTYLTTTERTSTSTQAGLFTVTGDAGDDIEPNTQIVFQMTSGSEEFEEMYSYEDESTGADLNAATTYVQIYNPNTNEFSYVRIQTESSGNTSQTGSSSSAPIWTVTELGGDEMMVTWTSETDFTDEEDSDNNYTERSTTNWTLTAE
ncbi:MAG: hypothetical protein Salg2KO_11240 [Salibacteraceae bacterium]